jgi:hypothetical protein
MQVVTNLHVFESTRFSHRVIKLAAQRRLHSRCTVTCLLESLVVSLIVRAHRTFTAASESVNTIEYEDRGLRTIGDFLL